MNLQPQTEKILIPLERIRPDPNNIRSSMDPTSLKEFAATIKSQGILQPLLVAGPQPDGTFRLVIGHRRLEASRIAGLKDVPCTVHPGMTDAEIITIQLTENIQRNDISPIDQAKAIERLLTLRDTTAEAIAGQIGMSPAAISRSLALLKLPAVLIDALSQGAVAASTAYEVGKLASEAKRVALAERVVCKGMTRDQVIEAVRRADGKRDDPPAAKAPAQPLLRCSLPGGITVIVQGEAGVTFDIPTITKALKRLLGRLETAKSLEELATPTSLPCDSKLTPV